MSIMNMIRGQTLSEWYDPETTPQQTIDEAVACGMNTIIISMNKDKILLARSGDTYLQTLLSLATQENIKVHILTGFQSYLPHDINGDPIHYSWTTTEGLTGWDNVLTEQLADIDWILNAYPSILGIEIEEPITSAGGLPARTKFTAWFREIKNKISLYNTSIDFDYGFNSPTGSFGNLYNSGIDISVINTDRIFTFVSWQSMDGSIGEVDYVYSWQLQFPNLEVGVVVYDRFGNIRNQLIHALTRSPAIPITLFELRQVFDYATDIKAIVDQYGVPIIPSSVGTFVISSTPSGAIGASVYIDNNPISSGMTPLTITDLLHGDHTYKLTKTGYTDTAKTDFTIISGQITTVSQVMLTIENIEATSITLDSITIPCTSGNCTASISVTWTNTGETSGTFVPNITIDTIATDPSPFSSEPLDAGESVLHTFMVSGLISGQHTICPIPNQATNF
jgi:hypothetical protein